MGDRALAIWQSQGDYVFIICNNLNENPKDFNPIKTPEDIEGIWTYIYYSYNLEARNAVGFIKFAGKEFQEVNQKVAHPVTKVVRFIVGGNHQKKYPGFNGLFARIIFKDQIGVYITKVEDLQKLVDSQEPQLSFTVKGLSTKTLVDDEIFRETKNDINKVTVTEKNSHIYQYMPLIPFPIKRFPSVKRNNSLFQYIFLIFTVYLLKILISQEQQLPIKCLHDNQNIIIIGQPNNIKVIYNMDYQQKQVYYK